jgi:3,4-dehydroadipyl-CoA semialdehyde dehydrogenase
MTLPNFVEGRWSSPAGEGEPLLDPVLGTEVARVSSAGVRYGEALHHARTVGGHALRALTYAQRAALLGRIADVLTANRDEYFRISLENSGATKTDAAFDVDGAIYTLKYYAKLGAGLGDARCLRDGDMVALGRDETFQALHLAFPLRGTAILINAFNFPAWGLWEKAAVALLSGVPVFAKPATATAWLAQRMVHHVVDAGILPEGAISMVCGPAGDLLSHVTAFDVIAFTGSAETAARIRSNAAVLRHSTRVNVEADSLNVALLGPDAAAGSPEFDLLVKEVLTEMTVKAGQKCTAIRRILVPRSAYAAAADAITARLAKVVLGNPRNESVRMGPVVSKIQQRAVMDATAQVRRETNVLFGGGTLELVDADPGVGAFVPLTLLGCDDPHSARAVHDVEVFGPVATMMPYDDVQEAVRIAERGGGSLVASIYTADTAVARSLAEGLAPTHGRVNIVNGSVGKSATGHGNVMPQSLHGGPGRAGNGQELGGARALRFYHQLAVLQGPRDVLTSAAAGTPDSR